LSNYAWVKSKEVIYKLKSFIENNFNVLLDENCSVNVNKLVEGQSIGLHNDAPRIGFCSHRFVVNLNKNYEDAVGGHFYVLNANGGQPKVEEIIRPIINTGFAFESSTESYHAIGKVKEGQRLSLVFNFWHQGNKQILKEELGTKLNSLKEIEINNPSVLLSQCLAESQALGIQNIGYHNSNLLTYATDTYTILKQWNLDEEICIIGFLRAFIKKNVCDKIKVNQSIISLSEYLDDFINSTPEPLGSQSELIQVLYFAHIIANKRISYFSSENWEKEQSFLGGIKNNLPIKAQELYKLIYE
jgi:2OG-Fe(II) oxygenase superfamily